ncbi:MAG: DNA-binding response regulator [Anaerolineaceae bacterium]|nr:DNA-binding response regulator [Anaerolineaceae bacterium]
MITILIVDDEPEIIRISRGYLEQAGYKVLSAQDGTAALVTFRQDQPDLVVLDLNLPPSPGGQPLDGLDVARAIRQTPAPAGQTPIIMLTTRVEETDRIIGLELGADDYVPKPFSPRELVARIRAVLRRTQAAATATSNQIKVGSLTIDLTRHVVSVDSSEVNLTPTEFALLQTLATAPGRAFTRSQLVDLLGSDYVGLERTVDSHIKNLRAKIEPDTTEPLFVLTVFGVGYKFNDAI